MVAPSKPAPDDPSTDAAVEAVQQKARQQLKRGRMALLSDRLTGGPQRPGQQSITRSPVVLFLSGTTVVCLVLAAIFWFINQRNAESRMLREAQTFLEQQKYLDAEARFTQFLKVYIKTESTPAARIGLHRTLVEKYIQTTTPDVIRGMTELRNLMSECGDLPGYNELTDTLRRYSDRLAYAGAIVAEQAASEDALRVSREAVDLLRRFSGESGIPRSREEFLVERQRIAEGAIARKQSFKSTIEKITSQLAAGQTVPALETRQALIDRFPSLSSDKDVSKMLADILNREKELVTRTDLGRDAPANPASTPPAAATLALRTQGRSDLTSQGRFIFTIGIDSCWAVDADTGDPRWRTVLGTNAPFEPIEVDGSEKGVLVYSTLTEELQLLSQTTGQPLWRQPLDSRPSAKPILIAGNIIVPTDHQELWQIAAVNGRALAKLSFPQTVIGPPAVTGDAQKLVLPGDQAMVYTISLNPFACETVSHIPHRPDSVRVPMLAAGRYLLLCDNASSSKGRIQTLQTETDGRLSIVSSSEVDGQILDPPLLRGYELFIPSTPQRISAFRVGDEPGQPPLAAIGSNQLEEGLQTRMFMLAGPGGQLWLAGRDLRRFRTRTNSVELDSAVAAEGIHAQPIQVLDESVFLTTRSTQSDSTFFTRTDREQMLGIWRTVIGSRIIALAPSAGGNAVLALADYGEIYRLPAPDISKGTFVTESVSRFRLPDKLASPIQGLVLADGRPAAWAGTPEPALWTFTPTGQLERRWPLPDAPEVPPVAIAAGAVFASSGRLHLTAMADGKTAEEYRASKNQNQQQPWKALLALNETQVLAVSANNDLVRVEYRPTPRPQLAEVGVTRLPQPIELTPAVAGNFLYAASTSGKLLLLQTTTLELLAESDLNGIPSAPPKAAGNIVLAEVAGERAAIFRAENGLVPAGSLPLNGHTLVGQPLPLADGFLVARSDGFIFKLNPDGSPSDKSLNLAQQLQNGFLKLGDQIIIPGLDGSLYSVKPDLQR
ncbi:MAG: PQQ-binding-like beta-propeller repeat protein [Planctomycetota bacterium]